ncbi:GNAT family N-acetyltransferase [Vibrio diabolicus]|uniref:GNAT family N-acetyltransferase n=1 Tax=Vibrio diabolicus TaxID=50719 RepID=UPI0021602375|nr:GNAT family N-acetyltransferase [Vibrio diabolicus]MCS0402581.1 GNAT family N-acetyltransferase [Vibrio diabolicus]
MITIEKYSPERHEQTCELSVLEDQSQFTVADVGEMLTRLEPTELPHLILADDDVVGFFLFDAAYSEKYDFCPKNSLGVRALLVDHRHQGKGIAKQAIQQFADFAKRHYPEFEALYLTVNCRNIPTYQCYLKSGFEDTNELYHGGPVGPQHIMRQPL